MTDQLRKAATQALDALERYQEKRWRSFFGFADEIAALRAALEQQAEPEQKPVGQVQECVYGRGQVLWFSKPADKSMLYTTPPQRQWVGLEAEDLAQIESDEFWQVGNHMAIAMAVEAKLKERNT